MTLTQETTPQQDRRRPKRRRKAKNGRPGVGGFPKGPNAQRSTSGRMSFDDHVVAEAKLTDLYRRIEGSRPATRDVAEAVLRNYPGSSKEGYGKTANARTSAVLELGADPSAYDVKKGLDMASAALREGFRAYKDKRAADRAARHAVTSSPAAA